MLGLSAPMGAQEAPPYNRVGDNSKYFCERQVQTGKRFHFAFKVHMSHIHVVLAVASTEIV